MRRNKPIITIIAMAFLAATVAVVSCKKEPVPTASDKGKSTLSSIKDFKRQLEAVEQGSNGRSATYMSIADAVWNLEALFNYTYACPNNSYGHTICCDTTLYLPVCSNDSVSLADLYVFNGQMYEAVLALYEAAVLNNKQFIILDVEAGEREGSHQVIKLHTVQGSAKGDSPGYIDPQVVQWRPFMNEGWWYYGGDHLNSFGVDVDAADTLTGVLNAFLVKPAPEGYEYLYTNVMTKYTELGENNPNPTLGYDSVSPRSCEFYKVNPSSEDQKLYTDQMNYYYFGERHLVLHILPNSGVHPVTPNHKIFQIIVEEGENDTAIGHHTTACYGIQYMVQQDSIYHLDL